VTSYCLTFSSIKPSISLLSSSSSFDGVVSDNHCVQNSLSDGRIAASFSAVLILICDRLLNIVLVTSDHHQLVYRRIDRNDLCQRIEAMDCTHQQTDHCCCLLRDYSLSFLMSSMMNEGRENN
jgi:hypothetical protein